MRWLRLQLPLLYLASILLAGALPCASHAGAHEAAAAQQEHLPHGHHAAHEAPVAPCHSGEALCDCEAAADRSPPATANSRDEMAGAVLAANAADAVSGLARFQIVKRSDPPERQSFSATFYDGMHGRSARLVI